MPSIILIIFVLVLYVFVPVFLFLIADVLPALVPTLHLTRTFYVLLGCELPSSDCDV
jgi:hypothetical protein